MSDVTASGEGVGEGVETLDAAAAAPENPNRDRETTTAVADAPMRPRVALRVFAVIRTPSSDLLGSKAKTVFAESEPHLLRLRHLALQR